MAGRIKRKDLTDGDKYEFIHCLDAKASSQLKLAKRYKVARSTISQIYSKKHVILARIRSGDFRSDLKRFRNNSLQEVGLELLEWFKYACDQNLEGITELSLLEKAVSIGEQQKFSEIDLTKINIGWIKRWKKNHSITRKRMIGEVGDVTEEMTAVWYDEVLPNILQLFQLKHIFNMDEAGLFWKLLPDTTHTFKDRRCVGGKKSKERITILIGSNMSGDEKLPILVIGKFAKLRCFKNVKSLPDNLIYRHSKRAWMTTNLFQEYVYNLDIKFSQQIRKVAIMIDDCPAHPVLTNLKSIEMIRLPKNTTSKTQPMDALCN